MIKVVNELDAFKRTITPQIHDASADQRVLAHAETGFCKQGGTLNN